VTRSPLCLPGLILRLAETRLKAIVGRDYIELRIGRLGRCVRGYESVSQNLVLRLGEPVAASACKAASSPTSAERSEAVSLVTSFGSCGSIYEPNILSRIIAIPLPRRCQRVTHAA
jgi:hypothetical protein